MIPATLAAAIRFGFEAGETRRSTKHQADDDNLSEPLETPQTLHCERCDGDPEQ